MTMHNLEDTGDSIRNTFSISPNTERSSVHTEKEVYSVYTLICDIGGVLGVYTAASGAALVQAFVLFANEGYGIVQPSELPETCLFLAATGSIARSFGKS